MFRDVALFYQLWLLAKYLLLSSEKAYNKTLSDPGQPLLLAKPKDKEVKRRGPQQSPADQVESEVG